jgi:Ca2+-binding RTX toxin-like protein
MDTIISGDGDDTLSGDALSVGGLASVNYGGDDYIDGGDGDDLIAGDALAIGGGAYTDVYMGGDDTLLGGDGDDTIFGDTNDGSEDVGGDDIIEGGAGADVMTGGLGIDTFVFGADAVGDIDTITDFTDGVGGDILDLADLLQGISVGDAAELDDYLGFTFSGGTTTIVIDAQGDGSGTEAVIDLIGTDITAGGTLTDQQIIQNLLDGGNLVVS